MTTYSVSRQRETAYSTLPISSTDDASSIPCDSTKSKKMRIQGTSELSPMAPPKLHLLRNTKYFQNTQTTRLHKRVLASNFWVDAFDQANIPLHSSYTLLSHFHADHYQGLSRGNHKAFKGKIWCGQVTANLLETVLGVDETKIKRMDKNVWIEFGMDGRVMAIDANHCPGALMFIFELPVVAAGGGGGAGGVEYVLHCGDFRADERILKECGNVIKGSVFKAIYLDTTYCDPIYCFPSISDSVSDCTQTVTRQVLMTDKQGLFHPIHRLIMIGTYLIGKERLALALSQALDCFIYCTPRKRRILKCLQWPELDSRICDDPRTARIHLVGMQETAVESVGEYLDRMWPAHKHALVIKASGWNLVDRRPIIHSDHLHRKSGNGPVFKRVGTIMTMNVAYSEHSSFKELVTFLSNGNDDSAQSTQESANGNANSNGICGPTIIDPQSTLIIPTVQNDGDYFMRLADFSGCSRTMLTYWHAHMQKNHE